MKYRVHDKSVSQTYLARQVERARQATSEACARRGIPFEFEDYSGWRPTKDRASRAEFQTRYGWWAFLNGNRWMAIEYGLRAILLQPLGTPGWKLLACALVKPMKRGRPD